MPIAFSDRPSVVFLIGGLGAGKTELSINLALSSVQKHGPGSTDLLDLDIVNPLFRVRKVQAEIEKLGVNVVTPDSRVKNGDLPALPAAVWGALENPQRFIVCDVGGGDLGLRPLARICEFAERRLTYTFFVLNPFRPGFLSLSQMKESYQRMERLSALKVTHLVANPHLMDETTPDLFQKGWEQIQEFSADIGIPIAFGLATEHLCPRLPEKIRAEIMILRRFWAIPWVMGSEPEERTPVKTIHS